MKRDNESSASDGGRKSRRAILYTVAIVFIVVAGVVAFMGARPAYRYIRAKRAAAMAQEARVHIEAEDWKKAADRLREANQLASTEPEVIRALAAFYGFADLRAQRRMLYRLYEAGDHNDADLRDLISLELRFRNVSKAADLTAELLNTFGDSRESLKMAVQVAKVQEDLTGMETYLRRLQALEPLDNETKFELSKVLIESIFEEKVSAGWREMYLLAEQPDDAGLEALRLIVRRKAFFPGRIEEIEMLTKKHPSATETDYLSALGWRYESTISEIDRLKLLEESIDRIKGKPPAENRNFYFWLNMIEEQDRVLELLPREEAYATPGLLTVYITSLLQAERHDDILEIIESPDELEASSEVAFIKAQCAVYLDLGTSRLRDFLQESFELALLDKRTQMLVHIANMADKQGLRDLAESTYLAMSRIPETSLQGLENLLRYRRREGDLPAMRDILREVREKAPDDSAVVKMACYHDLLQGVNMEESFKAIADLSMRIPSDSECNVILSFAHHRLGNAAASMSVAQRCQLSELSPSYRAVYAAIIGASGNAVEAVKIAEKLPRSLLLKEELDLVRKWLPRT